MTSNFAVFSDLENHLAGLGMFHMRLGMERMRKAVKRLRLTGRDWACQGPNLVQVVGTNGKGSTAFFLSRTAQAHGMRVGLFTSPHFLSFRERIRINGRPVAPEDVLVWANHVQEHVWDLDLTYFELMTLVAMHGFCRLNVDIAVLEAGLGGENDATSVWGPEMLLITPIGLDHAHVIGPDLEHIARDKAGAIKAGGTVLTGPQEDRVATILGREARQRKARLMAEDAVLAGFPELHAFAEHSGLAGPHQVGNARLALAGWVELCKKKQWHLDLQACGKALSSSSWPGRMQRIGGHPDIILDSAHNTPALHALANALDTMNIRPGAVVFNCMRDKDLESMAPLVRHLTSGPIFVPELPTYERARTASETAAALGESACPAAHAVEALDRASQAGDPVLVCGSLYLLAEVYALHPEWLES